MPLSDYSKSQIIKHNCLTGFYDLKPNNIYISLHSTTVGGNGSGTEFSGGGYSRVEYGPSNAQWKELSGLTGLSNGKIQFPIPTANWGTPVSWGIWDAVTGGNLICYGDVEDHPILTGSTVYLSGLELVFSSVFGYRGAEDFYHHFFRVSNAAGVANVYIALHTGDPTNTGGANEVSGGGYSRVRVNCRDANWTVDTGEEAINAVAITFPEPTANWGTITHASVHSHEFDDACLFKGSLSASLIVNSGDDAPSFPIGDFTITTELSIPIGALYNRTTGNAFTNRNTGNYLVKR